VKKRSPVEALVDKACGVNELTKIPLGAAHSGDMSIGFPPGPTFLGVELSPTKGWTEANFFEAIDALTPEENDALGWAMLGDGHKQPPRTIAALCAAKLVVPYKDDRGRTRIGVELRAHIAWCAWCSANEGSDE
jgi:hypothetical protein